MTVSTWVFGYGSLVSPASTATTIGRVVDPRRGYVAAALHEYGRRWNYGSLRQRARWTIDGRTVDAGVIVSLGIDAAVEETANGAIILVDDADLARLDRRESDYARVDVTALIETSVPVDGLVYTYVPRPSSIERYERTKAERTAAVKASYVELVERAFSDLGPGELERYRHTTPAPDVPVIAVDAVWLTD